MAKKSKTQKAKAAVKRKQKKNALGQSLDVQVKQSEGTVGANEDASRKKLNKISKNKETSAKVSTASKKVDSKHKKRNKLVQFFIDVRAELNRVTWPVREDIIRWSGVVVGSLIFFGCYVIFFDNVVITPILLFIAGFGG